MRAQGVMLQRVWCHLVECIDLSKRSVSSEICDRAGERRRLPLHFDVSQGGASDNLTFAEAGIPSLGFFAGAHADLHQPSDEVDRLSFGRIKEIAGLALVVVRELGSGETRLCR